VTKRGYLTPNSGATETQCRSVVVPIDDQLLFLAAVSGALLELTYEWNWEQYGDMTPAEAAETMLQLYVNYADTSCSDLCALPYPYDVILDGPLYPIRLGSDGHFETLVDGVWGPPTGDYEVPSVPAREESTEYERKCLASANAAFVLQLLYETATDSFLVDGTDAAVYEAVLGALVAVLGPWAGFSMASGIGLAIAGFFIFYELLETITADLWTPEFTDQVTCIFYNAATDTSDVITFDWSAVISGFWELSVEAGLDLNTQLLVQQVVFLLNVIGVDGLNAAGGTTEVTEYNCSLCIGEWCYEWDWFDGGSHGWTISKGTPTAGYGIVRVQSTDPTKSRVYVLRNMTIPLGCTVDSVCTTYNFLNGSAETVRWVRWNGTVISILDGSAGQQTDCDPGVSIVGPQTHDMELILDDTWFDQIYLIKFRMSGTGVPPTFSGGTDCS